MIIFIPTYYRGAAANSLRTQADASKQVADNLLEQYIEAQLTAIVKETCSEYVEGFMREGKPEAMLNKLTDQVTKEACHSMVCLFAYIQ